MADEPNGAREPQDIEKKEARESKYWLRMIAAAKESSKQDARVHWQEAKELHLIFASIWRKK